MNKKVNVLFMINGLRYGGMERQLVELIKFLNKSDFGIFLCTLGDRGPFLYLVSPYLDHEIFFLIEEK